MCIPPHALHLSDEILARVEAAGFSILRASVLAPTTRQATELCAAPLSSAASSGGSGSAGGPRPSVDELTAGRALFGVLCRPFAISAGRSLVTPVGDGAPCASSVPLMPVVAVAERTVFSGAAGKPACYMSDSVESAAREAAIFFPELEQPQTTVAVLCPHATAHLDDLLSAASALGLRASRTHHTNWSAESAAAYLRTNLHSKPGSGSGEAALAAAASELSSGPCTLLELTGKGAVAKLAALLGPADPKKARVRCPGSLRALFGVDAARPVGYASLSEEGARLDAQLFPSSGHVPPVRVSAADKAAVMETLQTPLSSALVALSRARPPKPIEWLAAYLRATNPNMDKRVPMPL